MTNFIYEEDILHLDSVIGQEGRFYGMTVDEAISEDRSCIMALLKKGLYFDDDVLSSVGIEKRVRDERWYTEYNGVVMDSTDWPEKEEDTESKVVETHVSHDGEIDETFYQV